MIKVLNIGRVIEKHVCAHIDVKKYKLPPLFQWLKMKGDLLPEEMVRIFNCGIGMVLVVDKEESISVIQELRKVYGQGVTNIGELISRGNKDVEVVGLESWNT